MRRIALLLLSLTLAASAQTRHRPSSRELLDDMADLPAVQQAFFRDWTGFERMHRRGGETVPAFLSRRHNQPSQDRHTLILLPVGRWPRGLSTRSLDAFLEAFFQLPVEVKASSQIALPQPEQGKYSAERIQRQVRQTLPPNAFAALALANVDIYSEDGSPRFLLFGQGHYVNRTAVASLNRLETKDSRLLHHRAFKLVAHELCHTFGLHHCGDFRCLMNPSSSVETSDRRPLALCPLCMRKLQTAIGFDPVKRYRDLLPALGPALSRDQVWLEERLQSLE